jgi:glycogen operon protein
MRRLTSGNPEPLGLTLTGDGANVAVFSAHARAIELCLFDASGDTEVERITLPERTGDVFHGFVAGLTAGVRYGLRARGPYAPSEGHRFNPEKLLVDPYVRAIDRPFLLHPAMFGEQHDGSRSDTDSAPFVPKGIALREHAPRAVIRPHVPWSETVLYELHVRGFTKRHPDVPALLRGTCAGLAHPAALDHLTRLGVTAVELLPVAAAIDERHLAHEGLTNYWGYNPMAWCVPDPRLAPGGIDELRDCVAGLHSAGIEVLLDIVFNHSGEGDVTGPTLSLRGLDNATYYRTVPGEPHRYVDDSGCGNALALDRAPVLRLALDTLRYYVQTVGVDGFRFDLATTLGRHDTGFDASAPLLTAIAQDPLLRDLKLVAEPWDIGPDGYQLGAFPASWGEWNDRYRDTLRRFWRGDAGITGELATRFAGSADVFTARSRPPSRSVNYITAHDGFTLADLVAYERKHNEANGEQNRDGTDANLSWSHGVEGATRDPMIVEARQHDVRALLASLFFSRGTPMLAMGDELGRTQHGNNNAYAQDNVLTWLDWDHADRELAAFVATLIRLRRNHPALRADHWLTGAPHDASGISDVEWLHPDGNTMTTADWTAASTRTLVAVLYAGDSHADRAMVALHAGAADLRMHLPDPRSGFNWHVVMDTAHPAPPCHADGSVAHESITLSPRSVVLLVEKPRPAVAKPTGRPQHTA